MASAAKQARFGGTVSISPVQRRVINALNGAPFEDSVAALGFALIYLLAEHSSAPLEEFDRLTGAIRDLLVNVLRKGSEQKHH